MPEESSDARQVSSSNTGAPRSNNTDEPPTVELSTASSAAMEPEGFPQFPSWPVWGGGREARAALSPIDESATTVAPSETAEPVAVTQPKKEQSTDSPSTSNPEASTEKTVVLPALPSPEPVPPAVTSADVVVPPAPAQAGPATHLEPPRPSQTAIPTHDVARIDASPVLGQQSNSSFVQPGATPAPFPLGPPVQESAYPPAPPPVVAPPVAPMPPQMPPVPTAATPFRQDTTPVSAPQRATGWTTELTTSLTGWILGSRGIPPQQEPESPKDGRTAAYILVVSTAALILFGIVVAYLVYDNLF